MSNSKTRKAITVTGKTGRGKTFFTEHYLCVHFARSMPVIVADSMGEYNDGKGYESVSQFYNEIKNSGLENAVYPVKIKSDLEAKKLFKFSEVCGVSHCLVVEEASKYCSPYQVNESLYNIMSYGRHDGISVILSAQRFAQINKIMTSQSDMFLTFQQTEINDLKQLKNYTDRLDEIKNLNKREFIAFGDIEKDSHFTPDQILTLEKGKIKTLK